MTTNGHDAQGRFAPGNPGGPGRPRRSVELDYLAMMTEVVTPGDWQAVVRDAVSRAKRGDARARDWLAKYLIGASVLVRVAPSALPTALPSEVEPPTANIDDEFDEHDMWDDFEVYGPSLELEPQEPARITASEHSESR